MARLSARACASFTAVVVRELFTMRTTIRIIRADSTPIAPYTKVLSFLFIGSGFILSGDCLRKAPPVFNMQI